MNPAESGGPQPAYVGLGANLDDPRRQLEIARQLLSELPGTRLKRCSPLYRSAPVGLTSQPDFLNAVCLLETRLAPTVLMRHLLAIEAGRGRVRTVAGGPRLLDLDLLLYGPGGGRVCREPDLSLPHPRLHERAFVLYPLRDLAPDLVVPGRGVVTALAAACAGQHIEQLTVAGWG